MTTKTFRLVVSTQASNGFIAVPGLVFNSVSEAAEWVQNAGWRFSTVSPRAGEAPAAHTMIVR